MSDVELLCGDCLVEVDRAMAPDGVERARCPSCGREDTVAQALTEAAYHQLPETIGGHFDGIKRTGAVRVREATDAERRFRFVSSV